MVAALPCERLTFVYEDGPRDAETLLIDPWSHDLYVVTKRENKARLYKAEFPFEVSNTDTLRFTAEFPFSGLVGGYHAPILSEPLFSSQEIKKTSNGKSSNDDGK